VRRSVRDLNRRLSRYLLSELDILESSPNQAPIFSRWFSARRETKDYIDG
jgi:hypothetical protein